MIKIYQKKKIENYIFELSKWINDHNKKFKDFGEGLIHLKYFLFKLKIKNFFKKLGV